MYVILDVTQLCDYSHASRVIDLIRKRCIAFEALMSHVNLVQSNERLMLASYKYLPMAFCTFIANNFHYHLYVIYFGEFTEADSILCTSAKSEHFHVDSEQY
jgi:hypothetical protein